MKTLTKIYLAKIIYNFLIFIGINKNLKVRRKNIKWNLDLSEAVDLSIFLTGAFQYSLTKSILNLISKIKNNEKINIIDIGSNIGDKSILISRELLKKKKENFQIYSIEPTDFAFKKQINNIKLNPFLKKKILSFKNFISNKKEKKREVYSSWNLGKKYQQTHKIHGGTLKNINNKTKNISLDKFVSQNNIRQNIILKIDTDGHEMNVLKSGTNLLKRDNVSIFIEYAPYALNEHGTKKDTFFKLIKTFNFEIYDLKFRKLDEVNIKEGRSIDIILIKKNSKIIKS